MRGFGILIAAVPFSIGLVGAQPAAAPAPAFDSASVQAVPTAEDEFRSVLGTAIHGEVRLTNATMMECLRFAFGIDNNFQIEGPDWMRSGEYRYNVTGTAPANTSLDQLRLMLQNLLAQRFRMTLRREPKQLAFLALAVSPKGLKLRPARDGSDASGNAQMLGKISSNSMSMTQLTTLLSLFLGQPVLDRTGLQGFFDVKLQWKPETAAGDDRAAVNQAVFGALEEQLGLVLEKKQGPLEVIVVDQAEKKPIGN
ncbi:MAG TPA: TIGR03435 family protein [Bryobacteraceae bacterium]|nr:TIGR03435 family protein [Bryobacteraceae bacterium]